MNIVEKGIPVKSFTDKYGTIFTKDARACNTLNKILCTDFKAVYRKSKDRQNTKQWSYPDIELDYEDLYIVRRDDKIITLSISEWANLSVV